jgi:hypothetical protein
MELVKVELVKVERKQGRWGRLFEEGLVALMVAGYLRSEDAVFVLPEVCRHWCHDITKNGLVWHRFAQRDMIDVAGPFKDAQQDAENLLDREVANHAFLPPFGDDPEIWVAADEKQWVLNARPSLKFRQLYVDYHNRLSRSHKDGQIVQRETEQLQQRADSRWRRWHNSYKYLAVTLFFLLITGQLIVLPMTLEARYVLNSTQDDWGNTVWQNVQLPTSCDNYTPMLQCCSWTLLFTPCSMILFLCWVHAIWLGTPYCRKKYIRTRFRPVFERHPATAPLRKIAIAEFHFDRKLSDPPPPQPRPPPINPPINPSIAPPAAVAAIAPPAAAAAAAPMAAAMAPVAPVAAAMAAPVAGVMAGGVGAAFVGVEAPLDGYRLLCKFVFAGCLMCFVQALVLSLDGWWPKGWTATLFLYMCPLTIPMVLPRDEWRSRIVPISLMTVLWFAGSMVVGLGLSQTVPTFDTWIYFIVATPLLLVLSVVADPSCDNRGARPPIGLDPARDRKEAGSIICAVFSLLAFWAAGTVIAGRVDAYMTFSWYAAFSPLWACAAFYATSLILDPY